MGKNFVADVLTEVSRGKLTQKVADGVMTRAWSQSGMPFILYR